MSFVEVVVLLVLVLQLLMWYGISGRTAELAERLRNIGDAVDHLRSNEIHDLAEAVKTLGQEFKKLHEFVLERIK